MGKKMSLSVNNSYNDIGIHLVNISRKIRESLNPSTGIIDLNSCLDAANEIESFSRIFAQQQPSADQPSHIHSYSPAVNKRTYTLMHALDLENHTSAVIVGALLDSPGLPVSRKQLEVMTGCKFSSINVYICKIRKRLKELGLGEAIESLSGHGYVIAPADCDAINTLAQISKPSSAGRGYVFDSIPPKAYLDNLA